MDEFYLRRVRVMGACILGAIGAALLILSAKGIGTERNRLVMNGLAFLLLAITLYIAWTPFINRRKAERESKERARVESDAAEARKITYWKALYDAVDQEVIDGQLPQPPKWFPAVINELARKLYQPGKEQYAIAIILAFLRKLPAMNTSPLMQPLARVVDLAKLSYEIRPLLKELDSEYLRTFENNVSVVTKKLTKGKGGNRIYPQSYEGDPADIPKLYFRNTPFQSLFELEVPIPLYDETRFMHHHILGDTGTSKTTLLSHLIQYDIDRVPEVSVVVLDSQFRMIDGFARLPKLRPVLIGPSHPIGLNLFKLGNDDACATILAYAFGALFDTEATALQATAMRNVAKAVCKADKPNLDLFQDIFRDPKAHHDLFNRCDEKTKTYLLKDFKLPGPTRDGIMSRISTLREHETLDAMLNADTFDLDMPTLLQNGSLILFDANKADFNSKDRTQVFGRMAIALVNYAVQRRMKTPEHQLKPTFFYMDEAHDYVANDPTFVEMMEQARSKRVGMVVAHHFDGQMTNPQVRQALGMAAIQTECIDRGVAQFTLRRGKTTTATYPRFEYPGRISDAEYFERYAPAPSAPLYPPPTPANGPMGFDQP